MNKRSIQQPIACVASAAAMWFLATTVCVAQESDDTTAITWWVIGTGGVLESSGGGDTLSATVSQTAIDSTVSGDSSFGKRSITREAPTAHLGFWLRPHMGASPQSVSAPSERLVSSAHPNPFTDETTITYSLPVDERVRLEIVEVTGKRVRTLVDGALPAGDHRATWNGRDDAGSPVASGMYIYRLVIDSEGEPKGATATGTLVLVE